MDLIFNLIIFFTLVFGLIFSENVCPDQCSCMQKDTHVNCDSKHWISLTDKEFPSNVVILTLNDNQLKFDTSDDRSKIENLKQLTDLSLNQNPLGTIPIFNDSKVRSLSLQDASLISAAFPSCYMGSLLQTILLSNNKIRTINENDFIYLKNSKIGKLHIDGSSLSTIHPNAFIPLSFLQSLSLKNNQLKTCDFLPSLPLLSSINFDGNQFISIPQELSVPKKVKSFSFKHNSISIIDESSPLYTWFKMNFTNIKISLTNNPFDCCQSLWFIRFLKYSSHFIDDAKLLTCSTPATYTGKFLLNLNPDEMNCGGIIPNKSWWTTGRIVGLTVGGISTIVFFILVIFIIKRQRRSRSGYEEIGGVDDPIPTAPPPSIIEHPFPSYGEDNDDVISSISTSATRYTSDSQAPTVITAGGISAVDNNRI